MLALSNSPSLSILPLAVFLAAAVTLAAPGAGAVAITFVEGQVDAKGIMADNECQSLDLNSFTVNKGTIMGIWSHPRAGGDIRITAGNDEVEAFFAGDEIEGSMDEANIVGSDLHLRFDISHDGGGCELSFILPGVIAVEDSNAGAGELTFVEGVVTAKGIKGYKRCAEFEFKPFTAGKSSIIGVWTHPRSDGEIRVSVESNEVKAYFSGAYIDGSMDEANIIGSDLHLRFDITHEYGGCELSLILPGVIAGEDAKVAATATAPTAGTPPVAEDLSRDLATWQGVQNSTRATDFEAYIAAFPKGLFVELAALRIKALGAAAATRLAGQQEDQQIEQARRERTLAALSQSGQESLSSINFGDYHALIIGIDAYRNLPTLTSAVNDAKAMAALLGEQYGFRVTLLTNPTRSDIIDAFDEYRATLAFKDNLLIYYSGRGWLDEQTDEGFWLPVDAKPKRRSNWVSNATLTSTLKAIAAKHVMVLADSCYTGRLVRAANVKLESVEAPDYFRKMSQKMARVVMTSGGLEPVADKGGDHSPFARALLGALEENRSILDGSALFSAVRRPVMAVSDLTPEYSDVRQAGHDGGDFLFVRR